MAESSRRLNTRPITNPFAPPIPAPTTDVNNLRACVEALKAGVESLIGQRGDANNRAVTFNDLIGFGLLTPQATASPGGGASTGVTSITIGNGLYGTPNPITEQGTVYLATPVSVANGGTGSTTAAAAPFVELAGDTMTGALYQGYASAPTPSTTLAGFAAKRWQMAINSGDDGNAGVIEYRGFDGAALSIVGAGTIAGNRLIHLWDDVRVNQNLAVNNALYLGSPHLFFNGNTSTSTGPRFYVDNANFMAQTGGPGGFYFNTPSASFASVQSDGSLWLANAKVLWSDGPGIGYTKLINSAGAVALYAGGSTNFYRNSEHRFDGRDVDGAPNWLTVNNSGARSYVSVRAPNFLINDQETSTAGTMGFSNGSGPGIQFWGTTTGSPGAIKFVTAAGTVSYMDSGGTWWFANSLVMPNDCWLWGKDTAGNARTLIYLANNNEIYIGQQGERPLHLRGSTVYLEASNGLNFYSGSPGNNLRINGPSGSYLSLYDDGNSHIESSVTLWLNGNGTGVIVGGPLVCSYYARAVQGFVTTDSQGGSNNYKMFSSGSFSYLQFLGNWHLRFDGLSGNLVWMIDPGGGASEFWFMRITDNLCYNQRGSVGGYGPYNNYSDRRSKRNITPSTRGLAEIKLLSPVEFERVPRDATPPVKEVGFVAQDVALVIPEAVRVMGIKLPDGTGGLDDVDPTLGLMDTPIIAALVNAVKELAAEVETLKHLH